MKFNSPENPIEEIEFIVNGLIDFSNKNEYNFKLYRAFAKESSKSFNRYFAQIENDTDKEKIISDLKTNFLFSVKDIVSKILATIDEPIKNFEPGVTYYIGQPIPDNRIRGYENNYKELIKLFLNKVQFATVPPTVPAPENEQNKMYFKVGLLFAKKEIYKNVVRIDGYNKVNYHFKDEVFDNPNQLSKRLLLTRQFINDSFTGAKTKHNIFNNLKQLKNIIDYCNKNEIVIDSEFLNKYTTLAESKQ